MKKILALLLAVVMVLGLVACGATPAETPSTSTSTEAAESGNPETWLCDEPTKLYIYNWDGAPMETARDQEIHDLVLEITNVDMVIPQLSDYHPNRAMFLASDEPIDLMMESCWWATDLIGQGAYRDVTDLVMQYGTNFTEKYTDLQQAFVKWDGKYYGMGGPDKVTLYGIWVNKTLLEENGLEIPTTVEEFNEVAYALKEASPDTIPLLASWMWLQRCIEGSYAEGYWEWYNDEEGTLMPDFMMPGYTDFATQIKTWYKDGILPQFVNPASFTNDFYNEAIVKGQCAFICGNIQQVPGLLADMRTADPTNTDEYVYIEPFSNGDKLGGVEPRPLVPYFYAVPAKSQNPELAIKFLNWMLSEEGYTLLNYGVEGEDFILEEDGRNTAISDYSRCFYQSPLGRVAQTTDSYVDMSEGSASWMVATYGDGGKLALQDTYGVNMDLSGIPQNLKDQNTADKTAVSEVLANYMWGDATIEEWEAAKANYVEKNAEYLAKWTEVYNSSMEKLGFTVENIREGLIALDAE